MSVKKKLVLYSVCSFFLGLIAGCILWKSIGKSSSDIEVFTVSENVEVSVNVPSSVSLPSSQVEISEEESAESTEEPEKEEIIEEENEVEELDTNEEIIGLPEDAFYLNLCNAVLWESGEYDSTTGAKIENKRRIRYPELIENRGFEYVVTVTDGYLLNLTEYSEEKDFLGVTVAKNGDVYEPSEEIGFFGITIYDSVEEKTYSLGQWNKHIGNDVEVIIATENCNNLSIGSIGSLIESEDVKASSLEDMRRMLLGSEDDKLADALWNQQVENGVYSLTGEELDNGNVTYFVSSSEGDDRNTGLDINHPKKSLEYFSDFSKVNVLLKCGDTFDVPKEMQIGSNCVYAAYGKGQRPVLNYYRKLDVTFEKDDRFDNFWVADLAGLNICNGSATKDNCNIGQLIIDGEINLKRCVWPSDDPFDPNRVVKNKDNAWAVDWVDSKLYMYSEENPNTQEIFFAPATNALTLNGSKNVVIKGLEIKGAGRHAINMTNTENILISCCYLDHIGGSVLRQAGVRYGNGVQVWNSGKKITVENNYLSWIFDTCFTHQGSDTESVVEHLHVNNNIGAHFFWGIEVWGDGYSDYGFTDVVYSENILFDNIDVTNPTTPMHSGPNTRLLGVSEAECVSYRNGYFYHQMSSINVSNSGNGEITKIENNLAWNSNRFLVLANNSRDELNFSPLKNNLFYAEVAEEKACMLRFQQDDVKNYCREMEYLDASNIWSVHFREEKYRPGKEEKRLEELLELMVNGH